MTPAIRVENLSKQFRIGARQDGYRTLRESLTHAAAAPWRRLRQLAHQSRLNGHLANPQPLSPNPQPSDTIWALKDVSFDVQPGEVVGIIGRNGAGKSTLLKVLSRITEPTTGRVALHGRVASLLEVGTGFHPELTGRENIYLNGAILGMTRAEIGGKFDDIVAFAEIEKFLDTPVKRYSSGMYVRLAFAVAAHLEPEILIIDEVLAVGDADFQKKCVGKMKEIGQGGRTVLFVSHNLGVLQALCTKGILLSSGAVKFHGSINASVDHYLCGLRSQSSKALDARTDRQGKGDFRLSNVTISMGPGSPPGVLSTGRPAEFIFELDAVHSNLDLCFTIHDHCGRPLSYVSNWPPSLIDTRSPESQKELVCRVEDFPLRAGRYYINVEITCNRELRDRVEAAAFFDVENGDFRGRSLPYPNVPGVVCLDHRWELPGTNGSTFADAPSPAAALALR